MVTYKGQSAIPSANNCQSQLKTSQSVVVVVRVVVVVVVVVVIVVVVVVVVVVVLVVVMVVLGVVKVVMIPYSQVYVLAEIFSRKTLLHNFRSFHLS
jgi:hypothetical protein